MTDIIIKLMMIEEDELKDGLEEDEDYIEDEEEEEDL